MNIFYVYIYLDPRKSGLFEYGKYEFEYEPFYVGKGKNRRYKDTKRGRNPHFIYKSNNIKKSGFDPKKFVIKVKENIINEDDSFILEIELIKLIGREDLGKGPLVNWTDGGDGKSGCICSDETRKLISEKMKGKHLGENNPMFGKHPSEETRKLMSEKKKGKHPSEETRKLISEKMKGENNSNSILTEEKVIEIRIDLKEGKLNQREIAEKFGVHQSIISDIKTRKVWNHIKLENGE